MIGKILIKGLIGKVGNMQGVQLLDVISQVRKQPDATSFEVHLNSEGGNVNTGFDIYNYLRSLGLPVTTIGDELVASIATVILMAGNRRIVNPGTKVMIHLPMGGIEFATADEMEANAKRVREVENNLINFYSKELNISKEAIQPLLKNETWLNENEMIDLGFITEQSNIEIAAIAERVSKTKTNKVMTKKSKLQTILNAIFKEEVAKVIFSADGAEINFPDVAEDGVIAVGDKGIYGGAPADGAITGADGKIYNFTAGVLDSIVEPSAEEEDVTTDELVDALAQTLEYTTELSERVDALATEVTGIKKERDEAVDKLATATAMIAKLKGSSKEPETDKKDKDNKKETVSSVVAQWKKNKQTKKH